MRVAQGELGEALGWARERGLSATDDLSYLREFEHITLARVLLARYTAEHAERSIHEVTRLLERLLRAAEEGQRTGSVIEILVLQALAHQAQDDISAALASLQRALTPAEPEGYVRIFVDAGAPMASLLAGMIFAGVVSLLSLVTLRQDLGGAAGANAALVTTGASHVAIYNWTFLLGQSLMPGLNALLLGSLMYRSRLVPRVIPVLGLIGAPLLIGAVIATLFGGIEQNSSLAVLAAVPVAAWELSLGVWLVVKGFKPSPITAGMEAAASPPAHHQATV